MRKASFHILRVGVAITFLWVGVLIIKSPEAWGNYIQPWAAELLPVPVRDVMISTAILDLTVGILLLIDFWVWVAALLGTFHLLSVLTAAGIDSTTVRDIGLLAATFALLVDSLPESILVKVAFWKKKS